MEDKQTFAIGDRVEQMCITCGEERGHIVASMTKKGKITRVSCPICASRVPYKSGTTRRTSNKVGAPYDRARTRSEEHTSELQSQSNLVCRLLLEKKKKKKKK